MTEAHQQARLIRLSRAFTSAARRFRSTLLEQGFGRASIATGALSGVAFGTVISLSFLFTFTIVFCAVPAQAFFPDVRLGEVWLLMFAVAGIPALAVMLLSAVSGFPLAVIGLVRRQENKLPALLGILFSMALLAFYFIFALFTIAFAG